MFTAPLSSILAVFLAFGWGRSELTERVWVLHTNDAYGARAATAFTYAAQNTSVELAATSSNSADDGDEGENVTADVTVEIVTT